MDATIIGLAVLGSALVIALVFLVFSKPFEKPGLPFGPVISRRRLRSLYESQFGRPPDFATHRPGKVRAPPRGGEPPGVLRRALSAVEDYLAGWPF